MLEGSLLRWQSKTEHIRVFMVVLVTCKSEEDPIKNEGIRVLTRLYIDPNTQVQLTPQSVVVSG